MPARELRLFIEPDPEEEGAAEVFVDGTVAGRAYRFLLDTGAAQTSLVHDELTSTFPTAGSSDSSGIFSSGHGEVVLVPSLEAGAIRAERFNAIRAAAGSRPERSLIGMDLLRALSCHFQFGAAILDLAGDEGSGDRQTQQLILDARSHPYVQVGFGSGVAMAVWDTGASMTVVDATFIQNNPEHFEHAGASSGTDSTGTTVETQTFTMSGAVIGGRTFPPHRVAAVDLSRVNATIEIPMQMILGYTTLRQADWLMDFPGRRWRITGPPS
ncbi:MAG TPA: retropepsin-like aspartic protease [Stellaceae bacterium]|nr:retropepsin-like aspartic protease [Stellaceae bacterium]